MPGLFLLLCCWRWCCRYARLLLVADWAAWIRRQSSGVAASSCLHQFKLAATCQNWAQAETRLAIAHLQTSESIRFYFYIRRAAHKAHSDISGYFASSPLAQSAVEMIREGPPDPLRTHRRAEFNLQYTKCTLQAANK